MTQLNKQDLLDILNLIQGAPIRFDQAERAVELKKKIEAEMRKIEELAGRNNEID